MEDQGCCEEHLNLAIAEVDEEEEFRSCCGEESEDECLKEEDFCDELTVKMTFKGISIDGFGESCCSGFTGIGVVIQGTGNFSDIFVQKRLEFYVEGLVADYLSLMDGLLEVLKSSNNNIRRVFATTDSKILYEQVLLCF